MESVEIAIWHGGEELEVVGEPTYQDELWSIVGRTDKPVHREVYAVLVPEKGNKHDENAVSVWVNGLKVGYLTSHDAAAIRPGLLAALRNGHKPVGLCGHIVGGGPRLRGGIAGLGVCLEYDRAFFGLEPAGLEPPPDLDRLKVGLSSAVASHAATGRVVRRNVIRRNSVGDDARTHRDTTTSDDPATTGDAARRNSVGDDARIFRFTTGNDDATNGKVAGRDDDLSWLDDLPDDAGQRLSRLRVLLEAESAPIVRHRMMAELEAELYAFRDTFPVALLEYDEITMQHDGEMETIRPALLAAFGRLPQLETYRQACIRHVQAKELDMALWWARRGMQIYGDDAADDAWGADLEKRAAMIQIRIDRQGVPRQPGRRPESAGPQAPRPGAAAAAAAGHPSAADPASPSDSPSSSGSQSSGSPSSSETPGVSSVELATCRKCRRMFTRQQTRARKPRICSDCAP